MNLHEIIGYPLFFVGALQIILGVILLRHNPRNSPVNKVVAAFAFFSSAFSLLTAAMYVRASLGLDFLPYAKATWVGWFCTPPALQFIYYLKNEKGRQARLIGLVLYPLMSLILLISLLTNWIVAGPYTLVPFVYNPGFLDTPARILDGSLILWLIVEIYLLRKKVSGMKKAQLDYFFYGTLVFALGGSMIGAFLQVLGWGKFDPTLSAYFSFPWVLLTFYAITRYRLFDIPLMVSKAISIALLLVLFEGLHLGLDRVLGPTIGDMPADLISLSIIGLLLLATPLAQFIISWINTLVIRGIYDYQKILKDSTQAIITILDLDLLLDTIIDSIKKSMKVEMVHLFLMNDAGRSLRRGNDGVGNTMAPDSTDHAAVGNSPGGPHQGGARRFRHCRGTGGTACCHGADRRGNHHPAHVQRKVAGSTGAGTEGQRKTLRKKRH